MVDNARDFNPKRESAADLHGAAQASISDARARDIPFEPTAILACLGQVEP